MTTQASKTLMRETRISKGEVLAVGGFDLEVPADVHGLVGIGLCPACGTVTKDLGRCKAVCLACGFMVTCND